MSAAPPDRLGLSVWLRLMKAHGLVLREARRSVGPRLTLPQFDLMAQLAREPGGLTLVHLSRRLLVSPGNLTGIVDRLEREDLVARAAHETDRRATRLRLTTRGRRLMGRMLQRHARDLESFFRPLPRAELQELRELLGRVVTRLSERSQAR